MKLTIAKGKPRVGPHVSKTAKMSQDICDQLLATYALTKDDKGVAFVIVECSENDVSVARSAVYQYRQAKKLPV